MSIAAHTWATNSILGALSPRENARLLANSEPANLAHGDVLCEPGKPIRHVYFPSNAIISLLTPVSGHTSVEVGLVGREGMAGMGLFLGIGVSPELMLVQGSGSATRMKAASFRTEIKRSPALQLGLSRYLYAFMAQAAQTAACSRHHLLGARLARRLLMTLDRVPSNKFYLTHKYLAHMLGVRRVGVTKAAALLQHKKLIRYSRGHITVLDRQGLERASCQCYDDVKDIHDRMPD